MRDERKDKSKIDPQRRSLLMASAAGVFAWAAAAQLGWSSSSQAAVAHRKVLVVYYSRSGNTRALARQIQGMAGGDIVELETLRPYPSEYKATTEQAKQELESGYLPPLTTKVENIGSYDVIFIGSPSWWGTMAPPVRTFLTEYDLSGKILAPFITHEGSGLGRAVADLKTFCPNSTVLDGLAVRGGSVGAAQSEVAQWLRKLGLAD